MIRETKRTWFEVWGTEVAQNKMLKGLLAFSLGLVSVLTVCCCLLALQGPKLIVLTPSKTFAAPANPLSAEQLDSELKRVLEQFVTTHQNWTSDSIDTSLAASARYISEGFISAFNKANAAQIKLAKEKKISQRFHITRTETNAIGKKAVIEGDRILIVDSLHAAQPMKFEIEYDYGERTKTNPEGIYVISEKLITSP